MNKEMLDILNDLSKKTTIELALQIMELSSENLILEKEAKEQKEAIDKAIEYINQHWVIDDPVGFKNDLLEILEKEK